MNHIVFLDGYTINPGDLTWQTLEALGHFTVYDRTAPEEVLQRASEAEILIVNKTRLQRQHFEALPALRLVCVAATGYDGVDVQAAADHGVQPLHTQKLILDKIPNIQEKAPFILVNGNLSIFAHDICRAGDSFTARLAFTGGIGSS